MNTLDELIYYCNENATFGALMLNGEWGCGKTHLIENDLKNALRNTHFLARISLFGIESVEALNRAVRKEWLAACIPALSTLEKHQDAIDRGKNFVEHGLEIASSFKPILQKFKEASALSDSLYDVIPIQNKIKTLKGEREFVLVFDDLERTKLNVVDALGCINEFCENQHFKAIIIANEDKIINRASDSASRVVIVNPGEKAAIQPAINLPYLEIKEKIICRTVRCKPNYRQILRAIISNETLFDKEYSRFLRDNEQLIFCILDTNQDEQPEVCAADNASLNKSRNMSAVRSRNLRSLKCALQDFYRVYICLLAEKTDNLGIYLYNFIIYTMAFKSGAINADSDDVTIDETVARIYPMYDRRYMLHAEKNWILRGDWDERRIGNEEELLQESEKAIEPKDRLRLNTIIEMDEEDILNGYENLLEDCYAGKLTLNEYVLFIKNASNIRYYKINVPCEIDWDRMMEGIESRFRSNIESRDEEGYVYQSIPKKYRKHYSKQELAAYDQIDSFRLRNTVVFEGNRQLYLQELKNAGIRAFAICENRRFNCFDEEMARATADCYESGNQSAKSRFSIWFKGCWGNIAFNPEIDLEKTAAGFAALKARLEALYAEYRNQNRSVSAKHTDSFLKIVDDLIKTLPPKSTPTSVLP